MKLIAVIALASVAAALPQRYSPPPPAPAPVPIPSYSACPEGTVRKGNGECVRPVVTRNLYLYKAPEMKVSYTPARNFPDPKIHYNYVFVRTPDVGQGPRPVVAPAPQQKTLVYLLSKRPGAVDQEVIEVPANPTNPEVYFVKYSDGENAELPGGIDLKTALSQAAQQGQVINSSGPARAPAPGPTYQQPQRTYSAPGGSIISGSGHGSGSIISGSGHEIRGGFSDSHEDFH